MSRRRPASQKPVPSQVYTREYFLSDACEGLDAFTEGTISLLKRHEIELLNPRPGARVLDVGCGRGEVVAELARHGVTVVGVDYAADAVSLARELLGPAPPVARADATGLPFADGAFDRVLMGDVIEHLPWDVAVRALSDIRRVLSPGGFLVVHTSPNTWFTTFVLPVARLALRAAGRSALLERLAEYEERKIVMHPNELNPSSLRRLLSEAGLRARVWVSPDVMRSGSGPWTADLTKLRSVRAFARVASVWPLRLVMGNDLFARAEACALAMACPVCGEQSSRPVFSLLRPRTSVPTGKPTEALYGRAGPLVRCEGCGLVRQDPPADAPYEEAEDTEYLAEEDGLRVTFRATLDRIERYRKPPGRLLDVGCGPGLLVEEAAARGWDALGVELSSWAVAEAHRRGVDVRRATLDDVDIAEGTIDAAVLADVIEHVAQPVDLMRRLYELMSSGGVLFCATPDVDSVVARTLRRWWWSVLPGHIYLFSAATLRRLMVQAGFEVLERTTHPKTFSVDYYVGRLVGYSSFISQLARRAARRVGGRERLVTPDFRDRVAIVARKP